MDIKEMCLYTALFASLLVLRRLVHRQKPSSLGFKFDDKTPRLFGEGALFGLIYLAGYLLVVAVAGTGKIKFGDVLSFSPTLRLGLTVCLGHLPELLFGEALFRGYILERLSLRLKPIASAVVTSVIYMAYSLILYTGEYPLIYGLNCFLLSAILSLMVLVSGSLVPVLGKEMAFVTGQALLFPTEHAADSILFLKSTANPLNGVPGNVKSGMAFTVVLFFGLLYEMKHALHHLKKG